MAEYQRSLRTLRRQVWELPEIKPIVTEYQRHRRQPLRGDHAHRDRNLPSAEPQGFHEVPARMPYSLRWGKMANGDVGAQPLQISLPSRSPAACSGELPVPPGRYTLNNPGCCPTIGVHLPVKNATNLLTTVEAAVYLELSPARIRQLAQAGRLGARLGNRWIFSRRELPAFRRRVRPPGNPQLRKR